VSEKLSTDKPATGKSVGIYAWLFVIAGCLLLYFLYPDAFSPERVQRFFSDNLYTGLAIYFLLSCVRGFTLIPLTPLLVAGILVFPPWPLFIVNLAGIWVSSAIIYYLARYLDFDRFFSAHYPKQIDKLTQLLRDREFPVILLWSFVPVTPTDLIVYVCSTLRVSAFKSLLGVTIGEAIICALYIFGGEAGLQLFLTEN
jgi:uncharacterized membrane protein YdjX (TVP38/TMEM64 family)